MSICLGKGKVIRLKSHFTGLVGWEWDYRKEMGRWERETWLWIEEREISSKGEFRTRTASSFVLFCWWEKLVLLSPGGPVQTFLTIDHLKENKMFLPRFIISPLVQDGLFYFIFCSGIKIVCFSGNLRRCWTDWPVPGANKFGVIY